MSLAEAPVQTHLTFVESPIYTEVNSPAFPPPEQGPSRSWKAAAVQFDNMLRVAGLDREQLLPERDMYADLRTAGSPSSPSAEPQSVYLGIGKPSLPGTGIPATDQHILAAILKRTDGMKGTDLHRQFTVAHSHIFPQNTE